MHNVHGQETELWVQNRGLITQGEYLSCDFCGSLHPDLFMNWVENGGELIPSDKNYKCYVRHPLTKEEAKFYYEHLDWEQRQQFVDLYNDGKVNITTPGYFYVKPYFFNYELTQNDV